MKKTLPAAIALAGLALTGISSPALAADEQPVGGIAPVAQLYYEAAERGEEVISTVQYTNGVPFGQTRSGKTIVGDGTDSAITRTWVPWSGRIVTVAAYDSTIVPNTVPSGALYVNGSTLTHYLNTGGEDVHGRATALKRSAVTGPTAGAVTYWTQPFVKGTKSTDIVHTHRSGTHVLTGSIRKAWLADGGIRAHGEPINDEQRNADDSVSQTFYDGTTITWHPGGKISRTR